MATIKDIADRLGIAVSSVSKGLNGAPDVSEDLRQQILDTAVVLGYKTKSMRKDSKKCLAIIVENMNYENEDEFGHDLILGFRQQSFRDKWTISVIPLTKELENKEKYDTFMLKNGFSGAFIMGMAFDDKWMGELATTTIPTVLLDNFVKKNPNVAYVGTDSMEGIDLAVDYLYKLGHRKIAFLNGSKDSMVSDQRQSAYEESLENHNLKVDSNLSAYGYYVADSAHYHVPGLLNAGATAIICGNDLIAEGVIDVCTSKGLKVPEDVSVIGFDDIPIAAKLNPALTTIRQDRLSLGKCAYFALSSLINKVPMSRTMLRPVLVERDSAAGAPKIISKTQN